MSRYVLAAWNTPGHHGDKVAMRAYGLILMLPAVCPTASWRGGYLVLFSFRPIAALRCSCYASRNSPGCSSCGKMPPPLPRTLSCCSMTLLVSFAYDTLLPPAFFSFCRYRPAARTKSDVDSGTSNQGFRCAADEDGTADGRNPRANLSTRGEHDNGSGADAAARGAGDTDVEAEEL